MVTEPRSRGKRLICVASPARHRRFLRGVVLVLVLALPALMAGCASTETGTPNTAARPTASGTPSGTGTPGPASPPVSHPAAPGDPADAVVLGNRVRLVPPEGWVARHVGVRWPPTPRAGTWCLVPRRTHVPGPAPSDCPGIAMVWGPGLPARLTSQGRYYPGRELLVLDRSGHAETEAVLASATFPEPVVVADRVTGWVTGVDGHTFTLQPFRTYTNDAEGKAYAAAHGLEYPYSNDTYDAPLGGPITVDVSQALCTGNIMVAYHEPLGDTVVPCGRFGHVRFAPQGRLRIPAVAWLAADGGAVQVSELYRP